MSVLTDYTGLARERFVETGTYEGNSLMHARRHFRECFSVEVDATIYHHVVMRFCDEPNVHLYHGRSPDFLRKVLDHRISTTLWLDAHYDGRKLPYGVKECPLLEELYEIERLNWRVPPIILIDDARMFTGESFEREPNRWKRDEWPTVKDIDAALPGYRRETVGTDIDPILKYTVSHWSQT